MDADEPSASGGSDAPSRGSDRGDGSTPAGRNDGDLSDANADARRATMADASLKAAIKSQMGLRYSTSAPATFDERLKAKIMASRGLGTRRTTVSGGEGDGAFDRWETSPSTRLVTSNDRPDQKATPGGVSGVGERGEENGDSFCSSTPPRSPPPTSLSANIDQEDSLCRKISEDLDDSAGKNSIQS